MGKENNEIKKAYDELLKTKNKCGKYSKTLFHIHTPVSHDYRLFKIWNDLSEKEWNKLSVEDYLLEVKIISFFQRNILKQKMMIVLFIITIKKMVLKMKKSKYHFELHPKS